jgi:carboxyl-terminal processing protease
MKGKPYTYTTSLDESLKKIKQQAMYEKNYEEIKSMLESIDKTVSEKRKNDLQLHKEQLKQALEADILSRYFLEKGFVEAGFKYDAEVAEAVTLFKDQQRYKKILGKS